VERFSPNWSQKVPRRIHVLFRPGFVPSAAPSRRKPANLANPTRPSLLDKNQAARFSLSAENRREKSFYALQQNCWARRAGPFLVVVMALLVLTGGCSWTDKGGTHHLIVGIGFGVITTTNKVGVEVRDSRILGGEFGPDGMGLGWMEHYRAVIDPAIASNVVISIKASGMNVQITNFDPYNTNPPATTETRKTTQGNNP
jgi:hypothetical protein